MTQIYGEKVSAVCSADVPSGLSLGCFGGICANQSSLEKTAAHEQVSSACTGCTDMEVLRIAPLIHPISDLLPKKPVA